MNRDLSERCPAKTLDILDGMRPTRIQKVRDGYTSVLASSRRWQGCRVYLEAEHTGRNHVVVIVAAAWG